MKADNILQTIGRTPHVRINRLEIASYGADNAPGGEGENADVSNGR